MEFKGDKTKVGLYLSGQQVEIPGANIFIEQPTIKQIVNFGEDDFLIAINLLTKTENLTKQLKEGNSDPSVRQLVQNLFELIFPNYYIEIADFGINFSIQEEDQYVFVGQIHPYNFDDFKMLLSDLFILFSIFLLFYCIY